MAQVLGKDCKHLIFELECELYPKKTGIDSITGETVTYYHHCNTKNENLDCVKFAPNRESETMKCQFTRLNQAMKALRNEILSVIGRPVYWLMDKLFRQG